MVYMVVVHMLILKREHVTQPDRVVTVELCGTEEEDSCFHDMSSTLIEAVHRPVCGTRRRQRQNICGQKFFYCCRGVYFFLFPENRREDFPSVTSLMLFYLIKQTYSI